MNVLPNADPRERCIHSNHGWKRLLCVTCFGWGCRRCWGLRDYDLVLNLFKCVGCRANENKVPLEVAEGAFHYSVLEARMCADSTVKRHAGSVRAYRRAVLAMGEQFSFPVRQIVLQKYTSDRLRADQVLPATVMKNVDALRMSYHQIRDTGLLERWGPLPKLSKAWEGGAQRAYNRPEEAKRGLTFNEIRLCLAKLADDDSVESRAYELVFGLGSVGLLRVGAQAHIWVDQTNENESCVSIDKDSLGGLYARCLLVRDKNLKSGKQKTVVVPEDLPALPTLHFVSKLRRWLRLAPHKRGFLLSLHAGDPTTTFSETRFNLWLQQTLHDDTVGTTSLRKACADGLAEAGANEGTLEKMGHWGKGSQSAEAYYGIKESQRLAWLRAMRA